jgi:hypothetical protein
VTLEASLLEQLLASAERAEARGSRYVARLRLKGDPAYTALGFDAREALHAQMRIAEQRGAVTLTWSRFGGEDRRLDAVVLADVEALASVLGRRSLPGAVRVASDAIAPWVERVPTLASVLAAWKAAKRVRGHGPERHADFVDAARVIAHMQSRTDDAVVRAVSIDLFGDSKRIEALVPLIDALTAESIAAPASHWEEVLANLGLRKAPSPFLLAGRGRVHLIESGWRDLAYEYLAVSPTQIDGYDGAIEWVLLVENLATFDLCAKARPDREGGLVLYTAGMPSPSWRRACQAVLARLDEHIPVYHWGDIDVGGFRIAASVAEAISPRTLRPWQMDSRSLRDIARAVPAAIAERGQMARHAGRAGWEDLAQHLASPECLMLEQEAVPACFPAAELPP